MDLYIRSNYKDSVFRKLFGSEEYKQNALDLYNAVNDTSYKNLDDLEIYTLEDVIYMSIKNDVSLLIDDKLTLWEHQSTFNPNMPLRGLGYFPKLYSKYTNTHSLNLYGEKKIHIPTPRYFVFYNGEKDLPERVVLRLSDLYEGEGDVDVSATMLNINYEKNKKLLDSCKVLKEYSLLVYKIREYTKSMDHSAAVDAAVSFCIANGILSDFLQAHRAEVIEMYLLEFDEAEYRKAVEKEIETEKRRADAEKARADEAIRKLNELKKKYGISEE